MQSPSNVNGILCRNRPINPGFHMEAKTISNNQGSPKYIEQCLKTI